MILKNKAKQSNFKIKLSNKIKNNNKIIKTQHKITIINH